ncbi:class I SAM-dependent methyltransferase [Micromonospora sp. WMMD1102]|uniref:class I SAM-dependent methyltransferase n=1 Tax=Micromonospora sp. WMMD1102 TaxID=3016105 RepID=UPI0024155B52|nr:class I SAM-dependent methyltransferase [Micromonospora sp. WMMD1102]MDG4784350.1 class I SAM-dependent methyltransferase [Micromonospora sp. WMMD1102]MDG4784423.1 class I SAM-dependent methyltransferase [Micromonospora sp. WMMD1102]
MQARTHCGGCGAADLMPFLDLGSTPLADAFPFTADTVQQTYPLRVAVCPACWLVQLLDVVPDGELYGADYGFYSSTSPSIRVYDAEFARWALARFPNEIKRGVVEVACNDGSLLQHFAAATSGPVWGVEPALGPYEAATARGLNVLGEPFRRIVAESHVDEFGSGGLVIAKNVAAHVADLPDFLAGIAHLIGDDGAAVIEVQDVAALLLGNQIDHVYHEHRFYFSATSLYAALTYAGMVVTDIERTPAQGGSLRVTARSRTAASSSGPKLEPMLLGDAWLRLSATYGAMQGRAAALRARLLDLLDAERVAGRTVAGYAATAKSCTLLNFCGIGPDRLAYVSDTTPHKVGRFTPGTHIPIYSPEDPASSDTYLLLAWNYLGDVLRREREFVERGGRFIVPIPSPVVI